MIKVLIILISLKQDGNFTVWLQFLVIFNQKRKKKRVLFLQVSVAVVGLVGNIVVFSFRFVRRWMTV